MGRQYGGLHSHVLYTFSLSIGRICHNFSLLEDGKCSGCYSHDSIRYMHPNVHCNSVYSSQDMETMNMSFNRGMDKDVLCIYICGGRGAHAQSCPTLCNSMDCSLPGSSVHGNFLAKNTGAACHFLLQRIFLTQGLNLCVSYISCIDRQILYQLSHPLVYMCVCIYIFAYMNMKREETDYKDISNLKVIYSNEELNWRRVK